MTYFFFSWNVYLSQISVLSWGFILLGVSSHQIYMVPFISQGACQTWLNYSPPLILRNRKSARCSFVKMSVLPSSIYRFNKPSMSLTRHQQTDSQVCMERWKQSSQRKLEGTQGWGPRLPAPRVFRVLIIMPCTQVISKRCACGVCSFPLPSLWLSAGNTHRSSDGCQSQPSCCSEAPLEKYDF